MDNILVEVFLPAANRTYDVFIPLKIKLYEVTKLLAHTFTELSGGYFTASEDTVLCDKVSGTILNINMSAEELGLKNGAKLMLI